MSDHCQPTIPRKVAAIRDGTRGRLFLGLVAFTLIRASEVLAAEQAVNLGVTASLKDAHPPIGVSAAPFAARPFDGSLGERVADPFEGMRDERPALPATLMPIPREYALLPIAAEPQVFSSTDFRPRGRSVIDKDPVIANANDNLMANRTVWQQLQEYRTRDRVRVITLWESGASAVSIQTNRKGDPSLQWTSRLMNRGGATRGLLDHWMPATVFRSFSHPGGSPASKPANALMASHSGIAAIP
jgi:hypothetical protein